MASFAEDNARLLKSISEADLRTLKASLVAMCKGSTECLAEASKFFLVPEEDANVGESSDDESKSTAHRQKRQKRDNTNQVPRYRTCYVCEAMFDVTLNHDKACQTHEGEKEIDTEQFPDDDEIESGHHIDPDTDWRVEARPEGFPWTCCDQPANAPGCVVDRHYARP